MSRKLLRMRTAEIPKTGVSSKFEVPPGAFPVLMDLEKTGEGKIAAPILLSIEVTPIEQRFNVRGTIRADIRLTCSRCLSEFPTHLDEGFEMTFAPNASGTEDQDSTASTERELTADEIGIIPFTGDEIDLREAIQQNLVMILSQRPICMATCRGLCQTCGQNLNEKDCQCRKAPENDRFAILKNLKLDQ